MRAVGIDPSLTGTAVAVIVDGGAPSVTRVDTRGLTGVPRIDRIIEAVTVWARGADLVVIEGPAHSRAGQAGHHELAGAWWAIMRHLQHSDRPVAVVTPQRVKKWATSSGGAAKAAVAVAAARRWPDAPIATDDAADAMWLADIADARLRRTDVSLPRQVVLEAIEWPDLGPAA